MRTLPDDRPSVLTPKPLTTRDIDGHRASTFLIVMRLAFVVLAAALSAGGVLWVHQQATDTQPDTTQRVVQVHLLPQLQTGSAQAPPAAHRPETRKQDVLQKKALGPDAPPEDLDAPDSLASAQTAAIAPPQLQAAVEPSTRSSSTSDVVAKAFQQALLRHVSRYQFYPPEARLDGLRGTVDAMFTLRRDGTVKAVWVETGSGQSVLDRAAIETIERAQPLPHIPGGLPDTMNIEIAIAFEDP